MDQSENSSDATGLGDSLFATAQYGIDSKRDFWNSSGNQDTEGSQHDGSDHGEVGPLREQDRFLPIANVARIMKKSIPKTGKVAKEAKDCVQECVSEFVSFITSEASERCQQEKRKTINGEDILFAMQTLGFDNFVEPLKVYLQKYRESTKGEKGSVSAGQVEANMEELSGDDTFGTISANLLSSADQHIIYTTYPSQEMPPARKRRRSQSTDTRSEENPSPLCHSTQKRRKKPATINFNPQDICQELYEAIRSQKTEDGRLLCEPFIRVPKRRTEPDYYVTVTTPMDLLKIQHKLKSEEYDDVEAMSADVELLVKNAQAFYAKTSSEFKQAQMLWELFHQMKTRLISQAFGESVEETGPPQAEDEEDDEAEEEDEQAEEATNASLSKSDLIPLKVPVLKLKVSGAFMDSDVTRVSDRAHPAAPETSSDVEMMSENQSVTAGRLSSSSEQDDQSSEVVTIGRPRRTTYDDLLRPKRSRKKQTEVAERKDKQEATTSADDDLYEQMFMAIVMATDDTHSLSDMFKILPSRSKLPDYYQVIKDPIDLRRIAIKIQTSSYTSLDDVVKDLLLMVQNAKTFNEPGSQIYKDASALRKIILAKKHDLELSRSAAHPIRSQRIRLRCSGGSQNLSSIIAALKSESDEEGSIGLDDSNTARSSQMDQGESDMEYSGQEDDSSDLWVLFNAVKNYKTSLGQLMSDPFLRLPSRRIYPDYYLEIKRPMSLMKIHKKLKNGRYEDLDGLCTDLNLVFENAKQYNVEESKIYKDAVKLQLVMRGKKQELQRSKDAVSEDLPEARSSRGHVDVASMTSDESRDLKRKRSTKSTGGGGGGGEDQLKKRLWLLFRTVLDYQCGARRPVDLFRTLPLKKDYPDYYKVISEPIDMTMIESKIKLDKYCTQAALVSDFELMFNNARHYNEEGSQVFKDATLLEQVLLSQVRSLPQIDESTPSSIKSSTRSRPKVKPTSSLMSKLQELYGAIRDYNDSRGRTLSTPFMKLPSRSDYPDYYEIIKKPVDMQKVFARMMANQYHGIEDMVSDLVLMFDNACRYNEPESLIYKDALTLQRVCLEKKSQLCSDDDSNEVPDVQALVQELMMNLFISTYSHTDEEGRCFSDSFLELPSRLASEEGEDDSKKPLRMAPSFEQIKRNLDRGYYKRVDCFQEDMFEVFEYAQKVSSIDSQVYEDCVELQLYFIQQRDELCKRGEILLTPALSHTEQQLLRHVESYRKERMTKEQRDDEERKKLGTDATSGHGATGGTVCSKTEDDASGHGACESGKDKYPGSTDTFESNGQVYHIGDFVYIEPREKGLAPHIVCIEHLHKGDDGDQWLHGCWFLRPNETYHLATRKFLQKEVFKSDFYDSVPFDKVLGKCFIMCVKEYFKMKPEGLSYEDVYVCESRYSGRHKMFKKIKIWQVPKNEHVRLVPRDHVLTPVRVASVFADKAASDLDRQVEEDQTDPSDRNREMVVAENVANAEEGCTYYEQYQAPTCWIKLGDSVYLRSGSEDKPLIARVDKIWTSSSGDAFFHGPYFVTPSDIEHSPTRLFYRKEVFLSAREQTNPVLSITGRCSVLSYKEFTACRATEIPEAHVYLCESKYLEAEKVVKKYNKPLKRVPLSISVCDDEIYFFKKPILPRKEPSPLLLKSSEVAAVEEESVDFCSSIDQSFNDTSSYQGEFSIDQTPTSGKKKKKQIKKVRTISGYIIYAGECRKGIQNENPDFNFGEISKAVGTKWKGLPREVKERYEERAKVIAAEQAAKAQRSATDGLSQFPIPSPSADSRSMSPHPSGRPTTPGCPPLPPLFYTPQSNSSLATSNLHPLVPRYPFPIGPPYLTVVEGFQLPIVGQQGLPHGFVPTYPHGTAVPNGYGLQTVQGGNQGLQSMAPPPAPPKPPGPLFVTVPPRTSKLVHSDVYLKYIEGLASGSRSVGDWDKTLTAAPPEAPPANPNPKLPAHWLGNGPGHHENVTSALWALRDLMLRDALAIAHTVKT